MLGRRVFGDGSSGGGDPKADEFKQMVVELMVLAGVFNIGDFVPCLEWLDLQGVAGKMKKLHSRFDSFLNTIIDEHNISSPAGAEAQTHHADLLTTLISLKDDADGEGGKLTDTEIKALLLDLFTAGTDTSSSTVEWAIAELVRHPKILAQAQRELDSVVGPARLVTESDLSQLTFLQAIIKETFRLHPSTPLSLPRMASESCEINGYFIPKGSTLLVNVWAIARDPDAWTEPLEFRQNCALFESENPFIVGVLFSLQSLVLRTSIYRSLKPEETSIRKMQGNGGGRDPFFGFGDPFSGLGGFGGFAGHRSLMSNFFGGRDPFDDPFFTRPFGGMFEPTIFGPNRNPFTDAHATGYLERQVPQPNRSRGPIIEELNSDDEREQEDKEKKENPRKHGRSSKEPYVEDPDDEAEGRKSKQMQCMNDFSRVNNTPSQPQTRSFTFQSSSVTYGGSNGAYYTSSRARRTGSDGLTIDESKEADTASGQANHRISRGIHDKGHTVARKLNSDGRVETMQTLHNLNEEELSGFEEAWKGNARKHLPGWSVGFNGHDGSGTSVQNGPASRGGFALPSTQHPQQLGNIRSDISQRVGPSRSHHSGRMKADGGDRTGSSQGRPRSAAAGNMDRAGRR